jgi:ribosomal protein L12E/L44/L45/RPP1/RPP2
MLEITALLLCKLGGNAGSTDDIKSVLEAAGCAVDEDQLSKLTGDMDGKDINELLSAGAQKVKDVPLGGGGGGGGGGGAGGAAGGGAGAAEEKAEEKVEEEEEMDIGGGMDMFGGEGEGGDY